MGEGKKELRKQLDIINNMVNENPCGMGDTFFSAMAKAIKAMVGKEAKQELSMEEVSLYFHTTPRTIRRWMDTRGFPKGHRMGHHELSFYVDEIVEWKMTHSSDN